MNPCRFVGIAGTVPDNILAKVARSNQGADL
jgi:hypothetical protein